MGEEFKTSKIRWINFGMCENGVGADGKTLLTTHVGELLTRTCDSIDATAEPWRWTPAVSARHSEQTPLDHGCKHRQGGRDMRGADARIVGAHGV